MIWRWSRRRAAPEPSPEFWATLDRAQPALITAFQHAGVQHVEFIPSFMPPWEVIVCLGTATDAQRDALRAEAGLHDAVRTILDSVGLADADGECDGVTVQSQQTVDRDFEGSWFYALR